MGDSLKESLRKRARDLRAELYRKAGRRIGERLRDSVAVSMPTLHSKIVAAYWPLADEIDVLPLVEYLRSRGCTICLPVVVGKDEPLVFRRWWASARLMPGPFGTHHPEEDAPEMFPNWVIAPLLAFDREGWRLGYGGGFYDRSLAALRKRQKVTVMGVAYEGQEFATIPHEEHDQKLDFIATESWVADFSESR